MNLTLKQIEAVKQGEAVRLRPQEVGGELVLIQADAFQRLCVDVEEAADRQLRQAWSKAVQHGWTLLPRESE